MHDILMSIAFDGLDRQIEELKIQMALSTDSNEVQDLNLKLAKLISVKNEQNKNKIKPETIFNAVVNTVGIAAVLKFEEINIISSKLWGMVSGRFFK